jgi:misacylated tRNA(Ala) deacylase
MTISVYLENPYTHTTQATVLGQQPEGWHLFSTHLFHPGGGGQPRDQGYVQYNGLSHTLLNIRKDPDGQIWHQLDTSLPTNASITCVLDWPFRYALMRHHALMHVVNTVAYQSFGAMMTGTQLGPSQSRIDLNFPDFTRSLLATLEHSVNTVLAQNLPITSYNVAEAQFHAHPEWVRTLYVAPPIEQGCVRVVHFQGFDTQACGGTHVHNTSEIGKATLSKYENKGKENKRLYWTLEEKHGRGERS